MAQPGDNARLAECLSWYVAGDMSENNIIPMHDLAVTVRHAILDELATGKQLNRPTVGWIHVVDDQLPHYVLPQLRDPAPAPLAYGST